MGDAASARPIPARAGIGLRAPHQRQVLEQGTSAAWLEVHPENYMTPARTEELAVLAERHPLSLHAVGLSLGSACGLDLAHLDRLAALENLVHPGLVSDHLSWSLARVGGEPVGLPDLLPLPYTEETLAVVSANTDLAQARLGRRLLIENPSTYVRLADSVMGEAEFLGALVQATGCGVLLDVNNIYVSAMNHSVDPATELAAFLREIPAEAIGELHLAGHAIRPLEGGGELRIDDHGSPVCAEVWAMLQTVLDKVGPKPVMIEWDKGLPALGVLEREAAQAQQALDRVMAREACLV